MKKIVFAGLILGCYCFYPAFAQCRLNIRTAKDIKRFFRHTGKDVPLISGHRGIQQKGYPENSIEAFDYVLQHTPAFFEIDPRLTRDSVIVLMHDATLERTTNGKGKVLDYTWQQLQQFYLKDAEGNITPYKIPTLAAAIEWARGKTILNLDKKDVPPAITAKLIKDLHAENCVMVTVHNAEQAAYYYLANPLLMMSAFVKTPEELRSYEVAGIPWKNIIAYIGSQNIPGNKVMLNLLHARHVMCMISAAPKYDKLPAEERAAAYRAIFESGADILESDRPVEVATAINLPRKSSRKKYFFCKKSNG